MGICHINRTTGAHIIKERFKHESSHILQSILDTTFFASLAQEKYSMLHTTCNNIYEKDHTRGVQTHSTARSHLPQLQCCCHQTTNNLIPVQQHKNQSSWLCCCCCSFFDTVDGTTSVGIPHRHRRLSTIIIGINVKIGIIIIIPTAAALSGCGSPGIGCYMLAALLLLPRCR